MVNAVRSFSNRLTPFGGGTFMARTGDPDSATSQFFIKVKDNDFLDKAKMADLGGYCVFGRVIDGMDVVDEIKECPASLASIKLFRSRSNS
jgi:cyclophilin family peptidyl-prolyl cis-trans isomerase